MADYRLDYIHDPDKNYRVRGCVLVRPGFIPITDSIQVPCAECDRAIWINPNQSLPEPAPGVRIDGDLNLCMDCLRFHVSIDDKETEWLGPKPPGFD